MIISIDIEDMQEIANMLELAREKINDSVCAVSSIVEHNNWNCKERDMINDKILTVKNEQRTTQEKFDVFADKIRISAMQFSEIDAKTLTAFRDLDSVFSRLLSVPTASASGTSCAQLDQTVKSVKAITVSDGLSSYSLGGIDAPIRMCEFDNIKFDN